MIYGPGSAQETLSGVRAVPGAGGFEASSALGPQATVSGMCSIVSAFPLLVLTDA